MKTNLEILGKSSEREAMKWSEAESGSDWLEKSCTDDLLCGLNLDFRLDRQCAIRFRS